MQNHAAIADDDLSVRGCARHWAVSQRKVYGMLKNGLLRAEKFGTWEIAWDDVWALESGPVPRGERLALYRLDLLTRHSLAERLGCCLRTVDRYLEAGMPTRNVGGSVRISPVDAAEWLLPRKGARVAARVWRPPEAGCGAEAA